MEERKMILIGEASIPEECSFLILEDSEAFKLQLVGDLNGLGFCGDIVRVESLVEAIRTLADFKPEFILSDWNLPDGTGLDLLKLCRKMPEMETIPFILVTTEDGIDHMLEAIRNGVDNYIVKPWSKEDLIDKISSAWLKRRS
jgi:two-component system chemotaxis response regulator CheY